MADKTTLQESSQALFCAIADYVGAASVDKVLDTSKLPIYSTFKTDWETKYPNLKIESILRTHVDAPGVDLKSLENFLSDREWYLSSVNIAKKLIKDIDDIDADFNRIKRPNWSDFLYVRGDTDIMKKIQTLFDAANKTQKKLNTVPGSGKIILGDINKWSPADIYFASPAAKTKINEHVKDSYEGYTFDKLNYLVSSLIDSGNLLPLSLKKQPKDVKLEKVNFDRKYELKEIERYKFVKFSDWKLYEKNKPATRDLKIFFDPSNARTFIKLRHDASTNVMKVEVEVKGAEARAGSIGSVDIFAALIGTLDSAFARQFSNSFKDGNEAFKKAKNTKDMNQLKTADRKIYDVLRGELSALLVTNKVFPGLIEWFKADSARADHAVQIMYSYITSRTGISGKFVIAK